MFVFKISIVLLSERVLRKTLINTHCSDPSQPFQTIVNKHLSTVLFYNEPWCATDLQCGHTGGVQTQKPGFNPVVSFQSNCYIVKNNEVVNYTHCVNTGIYVSQLVNDIGNVTHDYLVTLYILYTRGSPVLLRLLQNVIQF